MPTTTTACPTCGHPIDASPAAPKRPRGSWGVVEFQHRVVCYEMVDEWADQAPPRPDGGQMRSPTRTGRQILEARVLGSEALLDMTDELLAVIEADRRREKQP